jgi:hypothetical protein
MIVDELTRPRQATRSNVWYNTTAKLKRAKMYALAQDKGGKNVQDMFQVWRGSSR